VAFPVDDSSPEVLSDGVERGLLGMGRVIIPVGINKVPRPFLGGGGGVCRGEALCGSGALQAVGSSVMWWGVGAGRA